MQKILHVSHRSYKSLILKEQHHKLKCFKARNFLKNLQPPSLDLLTHQRLITYESGKDSFQFKILREENGGDSRNNSYNSFKKDKTLQRIHLLLSKEDNDTKESIKLFQNKELKNLNKLFKKGEKKGIILKNSFKNKSKDKIEARSKRKKLKLFKRNKMETWVSPSKKSLLEKRSQEYSFKVHNSPSILSRCSKIVLKSFSHLIQKNLEKHKTINYQSYTMIENNYSRGKSEYKAMSCKEINNQGNAYQSEKILQCSLNGSSIKDNNSNLIQFKKKKIFLKNYSEIVKISKIDQNLNSSNIIKSNIINSYELQNK